MLLVTFGDLPFLLNGIWLRYMHTVECWVIHWFGCCIVVHFPVKLCLD